MPHIRRNKELYQKLLREIKRVKNTNFPEMDEDFMNEFIYGKIPDIELLKMVRQDPKNIEMPGALANEVIYLQTVKILTLMESSENIKEFKELVDKQKTIKQSNKSEITGFDKILKGMMDVPPPKNKKK